MQYHKERVDCTPKKIALRSSFYCNLSCMKYEQKSNNDKNETQSLKLFLYCCDKSLRKLYVLTDLCFL